MLVCKQPQKKFIGFLWKKNNSNHKITQPIIRF